jgi:glycerophosphoryl diester phosphodiesterase
LNLHNGDPIEVIGHGGAGYYFPGNSRQSIEKALEIGVARIEFDVQLSGSGELVLVHDDHLRLPTGKKRSVNKLSTAEIRLLLPGLMTFDEAVELIGGRIPFLIDVKASGYAVAVADGIRRHNLGNGATIVSSTYASVLRYLRREFADLRTGISTGHLANSFPIKSARTVISGGFQFAVPSALVVAVRAIGATDVMMQHRVCSSRLVKLMHNKGTRVNVWTVDHPRQIERAITLGVDSITSNRPDLVLDTLRSQNR